MHPHVIQDYVFLSSVEKKLRFLMKTIQELYPYSELQWTPNGLKVKITVSVQLQRAINDTRRWIRVLSSETIGHLKKNKKNKAHVYALWTQMLACSAMHVRHHCFTL